MLCFRQEGIMPKQPANDIKWKQTPGNNQVADYIILICQQVMRKF